MKPRETVSAEPNPPAGAADRAHVLQALAARPGAVRVNWERRPLGAAHLTLASQAEG